MDDGSFNIDKGVFAAAKATEEKFTAPDTEEKICKWYKKFDGHYSMTCTRETNNRANGDFKAYPFDNLGPQSSTKWEFTYCPYCGGKIEVVRMLEE